MKHLTADQRYEIASLKRNHFTQTAIAALIGVHKSTISRELRRNSYMDTKLYYCQYAQERATLRWNSRDMPRRLTKGICLKIIGYIRKDYSPEEIVGYCRRRCLEMVSHETIYKFIRQDKMRGGDLYKHLRHHGRYKPRRGSYSESTVIKDRVEISERPDIINNRSRFGDFEIDTIIGASQKQHILTVVDRKSGLLLMKKVKKTTAKDIAGDIVHLLWPMYKNMEVHSITSDNGVLFCNHKNVSKRLRIPYYFAHPYSSWERGTNENTNGLIRQYLPKGTDFRSVTDKMINEIQDILNNRPRKKLNFYSPTEYYNMLKTQG